MTCPNSQTESAIVCDHFDIQIEGRVDGGLTADIGGHSFQDLQGAIALRLYAATSDDRAEDNAEREARRTRPSVISSIGPCSESVVDAAATVFPLDRYSGADDFV